jgi:hypothetical protein
MHRQVTSGSVIRSLSKEHTFITNQAVDAVVFSVSGQHGTNEGADMTTRWVVWYPGDENTKPYASRAYNKGPAVRIFNRDSRRGLNPEMLTIEQAAFRLGDERTPEPKVESVEGPMSVEVTFIEPKRALPANIVFMIEHGSTQAIRDSWKRIAQKMYA